MKPQPQRLSPPLPAPRWRRLLIAIAGLGLAAVSLTPLAASRADSARAYCVLSRTNGNKPLEQGPCLWSQRQGNVNILFKEERFDFPASEEGKTYTRVNRGGDEAGPVFSRRGEYTLSVYWRQPAKDKGGW